MDVAAEKPDPLARREITDELKRLLACIGGLDEERRRMVLLAYYNGLEPRAARGAIRQAGEHDQDLAAAQPDRDPGVPRVMTMDEDKDVLAAEYVLGTLDARRSRAGGRADRDRCRISRPVRDWERRLGELNEMVDPVEPPAPLWDRIKAGSSGRRAEANLRLPEVPTPVASSRVGPVPSARSSRCRSACGGGAG